MPIPHGKSYEAGVILGKYIPPDVGHLQGSTPGAVLKPAVDMLQRHHRIVLSIDYSSFRKTGTDPSLAADENGHGLIFRVVAGYGGILIGDETRPSTALDYADWGHVPAGVTCKVRGDSKFMLYVANLVPRRAQKK